MVILNNGFISIDVFSKPTDVHLYLLPSSSHPKYQVNSIPYSKSLKDLLRKSKSPYRTRTGDTVGCFKCKRKKCDLCPNFLLQSSSFFSCATKKRYPTKSCVSCTSDCIIYVATCFKCNLQYVGSTSTEFKVRFRNHKIRPPE
ncbi:hypothetical protein HOLleu_09341 [Holothuria leucospilota]|uniref:GIY-YIG domain-containing protein n=1 Tax=Holothuria leucospilota TaxID=206669 RepID=A0A9Q1CCS8_HOLLE|nr:hypothetical protein HOLleu_09341 [Holothuria leucospilota]